MSENPPKVVDLHTLETFLTAQGVVKIDVKIDPGQLIPNDWTWHSVLELPDFQANEDYTLEQSGPWFRLVYHRPEAKHMQVVQPIVCYGYYASPETAVQRYIACQLEQGVSLSGLKVKLLELEKYPSQGKGKLNPKTLTFEHFGGPQQLLAELQAQAPISLGYNELFNFEVENARGLGLDIRLSLPWVEGNTVNFARRVIQQGDKHYALLFDGRVVRMDASDRNYYSEVVEEPNILELFQQPLPDWALNPDYGLFAAEISVETYVALHAHAMIRWCSENLVALESIEMGRLGSKAKTLDQSHWEITITFEDGTSNSGDARYIEDCYANRKSPHG